MQAALDVIRTPTFRLAGISGGAFAVCIVILFTFVYWQTAVDETGEIDRFVEHEAAVLAEGRPADIAGTLPAATGAADHQLAYAALFARDGAPLAGNLRRLPDDLPVDGRAHRVELAVATPAGTATASAQGAAIRLADGSILVIARDAQELETLQGAVVRAMELGVVPTLLLSLMVGALLSWRALRRVRQVHQTAERIMQGNLGERLPSYGTADDFDRLAGAVNRMLGEIERLLDEIKGVGGDIAHDLRTPLTRVRTRLERGRAAARSKQELDEAVGAAITGLDQALLIITSLLRIAEIEDGRRRAGFGTVDLAVLAREAAELYEPVAEQREIALTVEAVCDVTVHGDRGLLFETLANVVDNAVKFAPAGGTVRIQVQHRGGTPVMRVVDNGPGIPPDEREAVLKRFYRSDKSRHLPGSGLGLGLVAAIAKLHQFRIEIADAGPGCSFSIVCDRAEPVAAATGVAALRRH